MPPIRASPGAGASAGRSSPPPAPTSTPPAPTSAAAPPATPRQPPASVSPPAGSSTPSAPSGTAATPPSPSSSPPPTAARWQSRTSSAPAPSPSRPSRPASTATRSTPPPPSPSAPARRPTPTSTSSASWRSTTGRWTRTSVFSGIRGRDSAQGRRTPTGVVGGVRRRAQRDAGGGWAPPTMTRRWPPKASAGAAGFALLFEEVDEDVVAEGVGGREERSSFVHTHHALDEAAEVVALVEHEGVDADALAGAAHDFLERLLDRHRGRRVLEVGLAALDVGGGLAVGDHDHLLGPALARELLPGEHERVLHVRAPLEVPGHLGQELGLHLAGDAPEAHEPEVVTRELGRDEGVQRHSDLLGRQEVVAHRHRERHVQEQHGGRAGEELGAFDLEVAGCEANRGAAAAAPDGVLDRLLDIEVERIAELVGLVLERALVADAGALDLVAAGAVLEQLAVQVAERLVADGTDAFRSELQATLALLDEAGLLEHAGELSEALE